MQFLLLALLLPLAQPQVLPSLCTPKGALTTCLYTLHSSSSSLSPYSFPHPVHSLVVNSAPSPAGSPLPLRPGLNIVEVSTLAAVLSPPLLAAPGALPPRTAAGAELPYTEVEAESTLSTTGTVLGPDYTFTHLPSEASGRRAVALAPGQYLELAAPSPSANALTIRYSIPDSTAGGGLRTPLLVLVNGTFALNLTLTSEFSWYYGSYPFSKNPSDGLPHHFYNEIDALLPTPLAAGAVLRLENPAAPPPLTATDACTVSSKSDCGFNGITSSQCLAKGCCWAPVTPNPTNFPYCFHPLPPPPPPPPQPGNLTITIDLLDFWVVQPPLPQPPGSLSVLDHGADPSGARDSSAAIAAALAAAAQASLPLYVPPGRYAVTQHLQLPENCTLIGAGPWHAALQGGGVGLYGATGGRPAVQGVRVSGLALIGDTRVRLDSMADTGVGGALSASVLSDLHISHTKCGMWLDGPFDSLLVSGVRIHDTTADGVNFHRGVTNSVVEHSLIRNTGDDCLAMWSEAPSADTGCSFAHNTLQLPMLANAAAVYGGSNNSVVGNLVADTVTQGGGVHVGTRFNAVPLGGSTLIAGNELGRAGCWDDSWGCGVGAVWFYALQGPQQGAVLCTGNSLRDSPWEAYQFIGSFPITGVQLVNESVQGVGSFVLQLQAPGSAAAQGVVAEGVGVAGRYNCTSGEGEFRLVEGAGNAGIDTQQCGFPPPVKGHSASGAMGPLLPHTQALQQPAGLCLPDRCQNSGQQPSAAACAALCEATPWCSSATWAGPGNDCCQQDCYLRFDGLFEPTSCGACDQTAVNKTSGWVPGGPPLPPSCATNGHPAPPPPGHPSGTSLAALQCSPGAGTPSPQRTPGA